MKRVSELSECWNCSGSVRRFRLGVHTILLDARWQMSSDRPGENDDGVIDLSQHLTSGDARNRHTSSPKTLLSKILYRYL